MKRRSSVPIVAALAVSVLGAGVTRSLVVGQRQRLEASRGVTVTANADLSKVNSFALGLLLGGLRGPLVMALWTSSENQKTDRDLEDFDTKVELIRLLQPEFDTVHLFQIWNKAYNISVQMANIPNKYTTILDALGYAENVNRERPDNINILASMAGLYFDKFGGAAEKQYFSSRLQAETMPEQDRMRVSFEAADKDRVVREARLAGGSVFQLGVFEADEQGKRLFMSLPKTVADALHSRLDLATVKYDVVPVKANERRDAAGHPTQHEIVLDSTFNVLPELTAPRTGQKATNTAESGARMPYLTEFQPFPYGVSPYALAFNYYKRSEWLQQNRGARHAQLSDRVIASRSGMSLEKWCEEEWFTAMRAEIDLAGREQPGDDDALFTVTPDLVLDAGLPKGPLFDQAVWRFNNTARLAARASAEYEAHIKDFLEDELTYRSHVRDLTARAAMTKGDALFLQTMQATGAARVKMAQEASADYLRSANLYTRYLLRYYIEDEDVKEILPLDVRNLKRTDADDETRLRDDELSGALSRMRAKHELAHYQLGNSGDFREVYNYVVRCYSRIRTLSLVK